MKPIFNYFNASFQRKLLAYNILLVSVTTIILFMFLISSQQRLTDFALDANKTALDQAIKEYLTQYTAEKATSTWLQLEAAQDNLSVMGKMAQNIIDNKDELLANEAFYEIDLFKTDLRDVNGALSGSPEDVSDTLIPPPIADNPRAQEILAISSLLNLSMDGVFEANENNTFLYFVGDEDTPVTRAYPNIQLVDVLGDAVSLLFWQDFFPENTAGWKQWYTDSNLQAEIPNPITVETPYVDAAGQGLIVTMFYPLWDTETDQFAGAVGIDLTLNNIIENVLSIQVGETGFAFLMSGNGEIIAMPERGFEIFDVGLETVQLGNLSYLSGNLQASEAPDVQDLASFLLAENSSGIYEFGVIEGSTQEGHVISFATLPALSTAQYDQDSWRIVVVVPEAEIFSILNQTSQSISQQSNIATVISVVFMVAFLIIAALASLRFSNQITTDVRTLAQAAEQVSHKNYDVEIELNSVDEIGRFGQAFTQMTKEIQDYTTNLEGRVQERTADLQRANEVIMALNERLKDENVRLGAELDVARQLQMMVLPSDDETQAVEPLDIACYMQPADEVGGDYYDVLQVGNSIFLGIGDVTGHGLSSGVIMLMVQTALLTLSQSGETDISRMLTLLNQVLYQNIVRIREEKNMTLSVIQYTDNTFQIVGQHESVVICRNSGEIEEIDTVNLGFPIGLIDDIEDFILPEQFRLEIGETALLYTDGITEAENKEQEQYGLERMTSVLQKHYKADANTIRNAIIEDVYDFIDAAEVFDDITMMVIKQR